MYLREIDLVMQREHYQDLLREAERERLAALAVPDGERRERRLVLSVTWERLLLHLGRRLSDWGCELQMRSGMVECLEPAGERMRA